MRFQAIAEGRNVHRPEIVRRSRGQQAPGLERRAQRLSSRDGTRCRMARSWLNSEALVMNSIIYLVGLVVVVLFVLSFLGLR